MKTVLILRHAKSSWKGANLSDHDRPLNKRGQGDPPRIGRLLREQDLVPEVIFSSTARRARDTMEGVIAACDFHGEVELQRELYLADPETYFDILCTLPDYVQTVMLIGHNPGLEELLEMLTDQYIRLPTAALAQVELEIDHWFFLCDDVAATLRNLWYPRQLSA